MDVDTSCLPGGGDEEWDPTGGATAGSPERGEEVGQEQTTPPSCKRRKLRLSRTVWSRAMCGGSDSEPAVPGSSVPPSSSSPPPSADHNVPPHSLLSKRGHGVRVIIIGAGAAGLSAGATLKKALPGASVKILEARSRIGGRILTGKLPIDVEAQVEGVVPADEYCSVDLGASYVHGCNITNPLFRLAQATGKVLDTANGGYSAGWGSQCVWRGPEGDIIEPKQVKRAFEIAYKAKQLVENPARYQNKFAALAHMGHASTSHAVAGDASSADHVSTTAPMPTPMPMPMPMPTADTEIATSCFANDSCDTEHRDLSLREALDDAMVEVMKRRQKKLTANEREIIKSTEVLLWSYVAPMECLSLSSLHEVIVADAKAANGAAFLGLDDPEVLASSDTSDGEDTLPLGAARNSPNQRRRSRSPNNRHRGHRKRSAPRQRQLQAGAEDPDDAYTPAPTYDPARLAWHDGIVVDGYEGLVVRHLAHDLDVALGRVVREIDWNATDAEGRPCCHVTCEHDDVVAPAPVTMADDTVPPPPPPPPTPLVSPLPTPAPCVKSDAEDVVLGEPEADSSMMGDAADASTTLPPPPPPSPPPRSPVVETHECDFVIVAVPLGVLKNRHPGSRMNFTPPLPAPKAHAIQAMGFGVENKVILRFSHVFWDRHEPYIQTCDSRFRIVNGDYFKKPNVLIVHCSPPFADGYDGMSDEQVVAEVMKVIKGMYLTSAVPEPQFTHVTRWQSDPFAMGAYSYWKRGMELQDIYAMARPVPDMSPQPPRPIAPPAPMVAPSLSLPEVKPVLAHPLPPRPQPEPQPQTQPLVPASVVKVNTAPPSSVTAFAPAPPPASPPSARPPQSCQPQPPQPPQPPAPSVEVKVEALPESRPAPGTCASGFMAVDTKSDVAVPTVSIAAPASGANTGPTESVGTTVPTPTPIPSAPSIITTVPPTSVPPAPAAPILPRMFFCGEHTVVREAQCVHGACLSGERAARQVAAASLGQLDTLRRCIAEGEEFWYKPGNSRPSYTMEPRIASQAFQNGSLFPIDMLREPNLSPFPTEDGETTHLADQPIEELFQDLMLTKQRYQAICEQATCDSGSHKKVRMS